MTTSIGFIDWAKIQLIGNSKNDKTQNLIEKMTNRVFSSHQSGQVGTISDSSTLSNTSLLSKEDEMTLHLEEILITFLALAFFQR